MSKSDNAEYGRPGSRTDRAEKTRSSVSSQTRTQYMR